MADWKESAEKSIKNRSVYNPVSKSKNADRSTAGVKNSGSWQEQAKRSLDSRGYIPPENRMYELKLNNGMNFGTVSYGAYNAIKNDRLDSYIPKNENERNAISAFNKYIDDMASEQKNAERQRRINSSPVFKRYNIDPDNFTMADFENWAKEHGFEYRLGGNDLTGSENKWLPKQKGGWKFWEVVPSKEEQSDKKTLEVLAENNERKRLSNTDKGAIRSAVLGAIDGLTFGAVEAYADWDAKKDYKKAGLDTDDFVSYKQANAKTENEHKIASAVGNVAGSLVSLGGLSKAVGAAASGVKWIAKAPDWVQSAINNGITFAVQSGAKTAFDGGNFEDVLKSVGINLVGGSVGGGVSGKVGSIGEKLLFDKSLQHKVIPEMIRAGVSSAAFAGSKTASTYFLYPKDYRPTKEEMAQDITTAFAFGAISSGINTIKTSSQNKKYLDSLYQRMAADYESMAKANISSKNDTTGIQKFAKNVVGYSNAMEAYLTGKEYSATIDGETYTFTPNKIRLVGQDKYVKSILGEINTIRNNVNAVLNGISTTTTDVTVTSSPANNANAPAVDTTMNRNAASLENAPVPSSPGAAIVTGAGAKVTIPQSSSAVNTDVSETAIKTNTGGEVGEIMDSEPIAVFTPKTASGEIKRLENILIAKGADDASRKEIVNTALEIEKVLGGSDKEIRNVFNDVSKITSAAVSQIQSQAGLSSAYWRLFGENFKTITTGNATENFNLVREYSNAYAEALKNNNPEKYDSIMLSSSGKDLSAELPKTVMQNIIPKAVQNVEQYRLLATRIKNIINSVGIQLESERAEIYGEHADSVAAAENDAKTIEVQNIAEPKNIILTRMGDFYEAYGDEAVELANKLNLTLTPKTINGKKVQMVGFPVSSLERYTQALGSGYNVTVSEQNAADLGISNGSMPVSGGVITTNDNTASSEQNISVNENAANNVAIPTMYEKLSEMGLTYDEQRAILEYKSSGSYTFNEVLRNGRRLSETKEKLKNDLNSALDKFPKYKGIVYRNIGFSDKRSFKAFVQEHSKAFVTYAAFTSCSKTADGYLVTDAPYLVHYDIESLSGRDVSSVGVIEEQEILYKTDTSFEIVSIEVSGNTVNLKLKENDSNGKGKFEGTLENGRERRAFGENGSETEYTGNSEIIHSSFAPVRRGSAAYDEVYNGTSERNGGRAGIRSESQDLGSDTETRNDSERAKPLSGISDNAESENGSTATTSDNTASGDTGIVNHAREVDGLKLTGTEESTLINGKTLITGVYELNSDKDFGRKSYRKEKFDYFRKAGNPWTETVNGTTYGHYSFYKYKDGRYLVMHLPTGMGITETKTESKAKSLIKALDDNLPELPLNIKAFGDEYRCYGMTQEISVSIKNIINFADEPVVTEIQDGKVPFSTKAGLVDYVKTHIGDKVRVTFNNGVSEVRTLESISNASMHTKKPDGSDSVTDLKGVRYVADFLKETFHLYNKPAVNYDPTSGTWSVSGSTWGDNTLLTNKYGTKYMDAMKIAEKALNMRRIVVTDKDTKKMLVGETRAAQQKAEDIKAAFEEWCFKDADRRKDLVTTFNRKFNANRNMDFSELAKYLTFDGLSDTFELRDYQKRAVARAVFNGNTLLAHGVGTGKTAEMIAIAMELKRMDIAKKNMMVVPNHKVADFRNDILKMYPSAKVAYLEKGANPVQRQKFYALVASNDFDIVIIPHSAFGMLDVSADTKKAFINNQISELEEVLTAAQAEKGKIDGRFISTLENQKKRLEEKLKFITGSTKDSGNVFEELGVDSLFVDEAHNFKNLPFYSKLSRVAGVAINQSNNKTRASRAENMFMITDYLNRNGGRITFGTATPITNSMSEIYNMTRFLRPDILTDSGLQSFDAWASMFGTIVNQAEVDPSGRNMRMKERFSKFKNVSQMIEQFRRMADILKTGDVIQELPEAERIDVYSEPNKIQEEFLDIVDEMIDDIRTNGQRADHNMLEVTTAGQMAAIDLRLVASYFDGKYSLDELNLPNNRTSQVAQRVYKEYVDSNKTKGTQFIFCDKGVHDNPDAKYGFYVYGDLINKLVALGIPRNEIAVAQEFKDKAELSAKVNTGEIRVLIGSTAVMGEGMNAQNKAVALHHMTVPDRPSDIEQREGRIIRYGNENKNVRIYRYIQEKSYDSYQWQMQERKAGFINQALSGGTVSELEEMSDFQLSAREAKAIASGNPMLLEKIEIEDKLNNLKSIRNKFNTDKLEMQDRLAVLPNRIAKKEKIIADTAADVKTVRDNTSKDFEITFGKTKYTERAKAAEALKRGLANAPRNGTRIKIGSYRGLDIHYTSSFDKGTYFILEGSGEYSTLGGDSASGNITRIMNLADKIGETLEVDKALVANYKAEIETLKKEVDAEFPRAKELEELQTKLNDIDTQLGINVSTVDMSDVIVDDEAGNDDIESSKDIADNDSANRWTRAKKDFRSFGAPLINVSPTGTRLSTINSGGIFSSSVKFEIVKKLKLSTVL